MSCVCILTPVVVLAWPAFSAAVTAAAASLGYALAQEVEAQNSVVRGREEPGEVHLEVPHSQLVTDRLARDQKVVVRRGEVTVVFGRDVRGHASVCVTGPGRTEAELRGLGEELAQRVVQQCVYQRITAEARARGFNIVADEVGEDRSIRLKIRHWET